MSFDYPTEVLLAIDATNRDLDVHQREIKARQDDADRAQRLVKEATAGADSLRLQLRQLSQLAVIERGLPPEVLALHQQINDQRLIADDPEVLVRVQRRALSALDQLKQQLFPVCPHTFLHYEPSSYARRNRRDLLPGYLTCLACGFKEFQQGRDLDGNEMYPTLDEGERLCVDAAAVKASGVVSLVPPVPWETIRRLFLDDTLRAVARKFGYEIK